MICFEAFCEWRRLCARFQTHCGSSTTYSIKLWPFFCPLCVRCKANYQSHALRYNLPQKSAPLISLFCVCRWKHVQQAPGRSHTQQVRCVTVFELYYVFWLVWCLPNITAPYVVQNIWKKKNFSPCRQNELRRRTSSLSSFSLHLLAW